LDTLGRQLLSELRIWGSKLLKWQGARLSSVVLVRAFLPLFSILYTYLGAYGASPSRSAIIPGVISSSMPGEQQHPARVLATRFAFP
jgi:hypothetical protein